MSEWQAPNKYQTVVVSLVSIQTTTCLDFFFRSSVYCVYCVCVKSQHAYFKISAAHKRNCCRKNSQSAGKKKETRKRQRNHDVTDQVCEWHTHFHRILPHFFRHSNTNTHTETCCDLVVLLHLLVSVGKQASFTR